jgi:hypothetical protein
VLRVVIIIVSWQLSDISITLFALDEITVSGKAISAVRIVVLGNLRLIVYTAGIVDAVSSASIDAGSVVIILVQEAFFDLPVALLRAHAKFEIFLGDAVPVLDEMSVI